MLLDWADAVRLDCIGCRQRVEITSLRQNDLAKHVPGEMKQDPCDRFIQKAPSAAPRPTHPKSTAIFSSTTISGVSRRAISSRSRWKRPANMTFGGGSTDRPIRPNRRKPSAGR
jgi:hypothetical protein